MKKIMIVVTALILTAAIAALAFAANAKKAGTAENVQIPNPFQECSTLDEAAGIAGFEISVPETLPGGYTQRVIRVMKDSLIEVLYSHGDAQIRIRKGAGSEDISGDYNVYDETDTVTIGDFQVALKGNDGKVKLAIWTYDGYSFSITASESMDSGSMVELIQTVQ